MKLHPKPVVIAPGPFEVESVSTYFPTGITARIISQRGFFTISGKPNISLEDQLDARLRKMVIPKGSKKELLKALDFCGVNALSIYQDLDHLSLYLHDYLFSTDKKNSPSSTIPPDNRPVG